MPLAEFSLLALAAIGMILGGWSIFLTRSAAHVRSGQRLCIGTLAVLGLATMLAAWWQAYALTPLGLCTGLLLVATVIEAPARAGVVRTPAD
jgi:hypothetical protein